MSVNVYRFNQAARVEDPTLFSSNTKDYSVFQLKSPLHTLTVIVGSGLTTSHFNTGTELGDIIIDISNGKWYAKTGATTWTDLTA